MPEDLEKPKGVYSTSASSFVGAGMTRRKATQKRYWFVWDVEEGDHALVSPLNQNLVPTGQKRVVPFEEFRKNFSPEPDFFVDNSLKVRKLWRSSDEEGGHQEYEPQDLDDFPERSTRSASVSKEAFRKPSDERRAESERIEREARADFGLGITYLKRGEKGKAIKIFEDLAEMDAEFEAEHKHMFNDFGIGLRKSNLLRVALKHYRRALDLAPHDENIYHNMARLQYELGDYKKAEFYLNKSLEINPNLKESKLFLKFLQKMRGKGQPEAS